MNQPSSSLSVPVAIYARVSTSKQVGGRFDSCESQVAVCREYLARKVSLGWHEAACFVDEAYTGGNVERPGIQSLKREILAGRIKVVLVYKFERVLRSTDEWTPLRALLKKHGCQLVSVTEELEDETASGRLKTNMLVSFSEYQRLNDREKSISKQREQAKRGYWHGGLDGYGYLNDRTEKQLKVEATESKIVREVFERAAKLESLTDISNDMTQRGVRTRVRIFKRRSQQKVTVGGKSIRSDWLRMLIRNPLYRGVVRHEGQEYTGQHEALVTAELWEAANAAIAEMKHPVRTAPNRDKHVNLLKGLLVCGCCGTALVPHASGKLDANGKPYRYYVCHRQLKERSASQCSLRQVAGPAIERAVIAILAQMSRHPDVVAAVLSTGKDYSETRVAPLEKQLRAMGRELDQTTRELRNLAMALARDGLDALVDELRERAESLKVRKNKLTVERERTEQELDSLKQEKLAPERVCAALKQFDELWLKMSDEERREMVGLLIKRVEVRPSENARSGEGGKTAGPMRIRLLIKLHLPNLLGSDGETSVSLIRKKSVALDAEVKLPAGSGGISILSPFLFTSSRAPADKHKKTKLRCREHPIQRAHRWNSRAVGCPGQQKISLRKLAKIEGLSVTVVSQTLKLIELTPSVQKAALEMHAAGLVRHIGLRALRNIAALPSSRQVTAFEEMTRRSILPDRSKIGNNPPWPKR